MTEIEQKALALLNEVSEERMNILVGHINRTIKAHEALCRAIEQHEAFRQEVSDAVANWKDMSDFSSFETMLKLAEQDLFGFIIPAPKPDPLVEVFAECDDGTWDTKAEYADKFRAALESRGLEIRSKNDDQ